MPAAFDLTNNPFHLLDISVRDHRERVVEAHEEVLASGRVDEGVLAKAQQSVLTPRGRLDAEVRWLPGVVPSHAREILLRVQQGALGKASEALGSLRGLDKANLAADLCIRSSGQIRYVHELLESYGEFTAADVLDTLTRSRSVSGFPAPDQQQVEKALANLKIAHSKAAITCISAAGGPGAEMLGIVEAFLGCHEDAAKHLLDLIVREYDAWSEPRLGEIRERIKTAISEYREGHCPNPVDQIVELLAEWDEISQPVQLLEESKGHEEPRSREIYEIVRDFCLWLANENDHYEEALTISRALLNTFPELPAVAAQLSKDVDVLENLAIQAKSSKLMGPLVEAYEAARERISDFDAGLVVHDFGPDAHGLVKRLYDAFADAAASAAGTELADMPWMVVRGLAIDLNNEHSSPDAACKVLEGLLAHRGTAPSRAVLDRLRADQRTLSRNLKWEELKRCSGEASASISIISELLEDADDPERSALLKLRATLERKRTAKTRRVLWALAAAAAVGFVMHIDATNESSYSPRSSTTAPPARSASTVTSPPSLALRPNRDRQGAASGTGGPFDEPDTGPDTSRPSSTTALLPPSTAPGLLALPEERIPSPGFDRTLGRNEVRYCIFQGERLDLLRDLVTADWQIDRFNEMVSGFNSRCSSFRYQEGVLQAVQAELSERRYELEVEVRHLLESWGANQPQASAADVLIDIGTVSGAMLVQSRLKQLGHYPSTVDGIWGPASRAALRNFKLSQSALNYDDQWDLATQQALLGR